MAGREIRRKDGDDGRGRGRGSDVVISKALSYTLRHGAEKQGLPLRPDGYARVSDLLAMPKFRSLNLDLDTLKRLTKESDKQRFKLILASEEDKNSSAAKSATKSTTTTTTTVTQTSTAISSNIGGSEKYPETTKKLNSFTLEEDESDTGNIIDATGESTWTSSNPADYLIRANQGHSIKITSTSLDLTLITPGNLPPACVHGTFYRFWELILASGGLKPMGRVHIHFAPGLPGEGQVISGMRRDAEVLIYVDILKAIKESEGRIKFWKSANEVILSEGDQEKGGLLGLEFVEKVVDFKKGLGTLWEGGKLVRELPEHLKGSQPPIGKEKRLGKGRR